MASDLYRRAQFLGQAVDSRLDSYPDRMGARTVSGYSDPLSVCVQ